VGQEDGEAARVGQTVAARERDADERQALVDERERQADEREAVADQRDRQVDERDWEFDEHIQRLGMTVLDLKQRTQASIERSRALLARSGETLNRDKERLRRSQERSRRQQAEIDRASAKSARGLSVLPPDSGSVIDRSRQLYQQALTVIEAFAASQEQVADINEDLAASRTSHREEYRRAAEQARATAHRAREILRTLKTD